MASLVVIKNDIPVVSTLDMFGSLGVKHKALIDLVKKYKKEFDSIRTFHFLKAKSSGGRRADFCYLDEEQATFLITLMKNSKVVVPFKLKLTKEFYRQKRLLANLSAQQQNQAWLEEREAGKKVRIEQTDVIQKFIDYAVEQGSTNYLKKPNTAFSNITKMENKALFILEHKFKNLRDALNLNQLSVIKSADTIAMRALDDGMRQGLHYKDIYQLAKERVTFFSDLHGKTLIPSSQFKQIKQ